MTLTPTRTESITADRIAELQDVNLRRVALSVDGGDPKDHDAFRSVSGSFEATIDAAAAAHEADLSLQINTAVCAETVAQLPAIRDLVEELGAVMWSVCFLVPVGRGRALTQSSPERTERVVGWLQEVSEAVPFEPETTEALHYRRVSMQQERESSDEASDQGDAESDGGSRSSSGPSSGVDRRTGIRAGQGFAFVGHASDVYPSGFLSESVGNVRKQSVVDIYRDSSLFKSLRDHESLEGKWGGCPYRGVCGGSRSRAYAETGDPLASDPLCSFVLDDCDGPLLGDGEHGRVPTD